MKDFETETRHNEKSVVERLLSINFQSETAEASSSSSSRVKNIKSDDCKLELWRCLSTCIEDVVKIMDSRSSILNITQSILAKIAFHGPKQSLWGSLMTVSSARNIVR